MEENQERRKKQKQEKAEETKKQEDNEGMQKKEEEKQEGGMKCLKRGCNCERERAPGWDFCVFHLDAKDAGKLIKTMTLNEASETVAGVFKELASLKQHAYLAKEEFAVNELSNWARLKEPVALVEKGVGETLVELSEVKVPGAEEVIQAENRAEELEKNAEEKIKRSYFLKLRGLLSIAKAVASTAKSEAVNLEEQVEAALKAIAESEAAEGLFHS